ncbi:hypothetical protein F3J17_09555 [Burkholderia sp. Ax-1719]|nr:hypothetical protein [Burkholderia sp. Ax-1719]
MTNKSNGQDLTAEFEAITSLFGLEQIAPGRYSRLLLMTLYGGLKSGTVDPNRVVYEIEALEGLGPASKTKPPTQNKHPPLKGLWHKHYQEPGIPSMGMNVKKGLRRYGIPFFEQKMREAEAAGEVRAVPLEDVDAIVGDIVAGNLKRLADEQAMTGEWLIYARHEDQNYYLCIGTHHEETHSNLRQLVDAICCEDFPFLSKLLDDAASGG